MANSGQLTPEEVLQQFTGQSAAEQEAPEFDIAESFRQTLNKITETDPAFDPTGIQDAGFRADFSRMDTDDERNDFLRRQVGEHGFTQDAFGNYALTPAGLETIGIPGAQRPRLIDEPQLTQFDIADLRGDAPAIAGGTLMGIATGGAGFLVGVLSTAAGAAAAKGIDEAADALRGDNLQTPGEIATDIAKEAAFSGGGETFARTVMPLGRKLLAPEAKRMTDRAKQLAQDAFDLGAKPNVSQLTRAPILGRTQSMLNRVFGDPNELVNAGALSNEMATLSREAGEVISKRTDLGELISTNIKQARREFATDSGSMYQIVDDLVGDKPVISTAKLKETAEGILADMPRTVQGRAVFVSPETTGELGAISELPDFISAKQMQTIRSRLFDAQRVNNLVPGIESRHARLLHRAANRSFENSRDPATVAQALASHFEMTLDEASAMRVFGGESPQRVVSNAVDALKSADEFYKEGIKKFDNALISRITREPGIAGAIQPESIIGSVFRKGQVSQLERVMGLLPNDVQGNMRRAAMDDILDNLVDNTADPIKAVFNGPRFRNTLDGYGKETLEAMFGQDRTEQMYRLARVAQLVGSRQAMSGGLVAAHIALHPLRNLGRLARMNVVSKIMNSEQGIKWLTVGLDAPKTRAGVSALTRLSAQVQALAEDELQGDIEEVRE